MSTSERAHVRYDVEPRRGRRAQLGSAHGSDRAPPRSSSTASRSTTRAATSAAVEDLSLTIPAGEICVLVGPVGRRQDDRDEDGQPPDRATTRATSGSTGRASATTTSTELRRGIGYVIQQVGLFPHMTIADNIGTVPRLLGWPKRPDRASGRPSCSSSSASSRSTATRYPGAALGRPAPARRPRPRARRRPAADADGRAVRRARPDHARPPPDRVPAPARGGAQDGDLRHARHRRGDQARRPDRDPARGRRTWRSTTRPTGSSPHPADEFVARFVGADRGLKRLALRRLDEIELEPARTASRRAARRARPARRRCATRSR